MMSSAKGWRILSARIFAFGGMECLPGPRTGRGAPPGHLVGMASPDPSGLDAPEFAPPGVVHTDMLSRPSGHVKEQGRDGRRRGGAGPGVRGVTRPTRWGRRTRRTTPRATGWLLW